mgnify:CR=1 FL=1
MSNIIAFLKVLEDWIDETHCGECPCIRKLDHKICLHDPAAVNRKNFREIKARLRRFIEVHPTSKYEPWFEQMIQVFNTNIKGADDRQCFMVVYQMYRLLVFMV